MKKKKKHNYVSQNDLYEMKTNNNIDYTTENFDSLEFGEDLAFNEQNKPYVEEIKIPMNKKKKKR